MSRYRVSAVARSDLDHIWSYVAKDNMVAADRIVHAIVSRFQILASMPELGRLRKELAARVRSFPVGRYVIFYRPDEGGIEIVRVLHGARDLPPLLE